MEQLNSLVNLLRYKKTSLIALVLVVSAIAIAQVRHKQLNVDNLQLDGNTISSTDTDGNINLNPDGSGAVILPDQTASRVAIFSTSKDLISASVTTTELALLSGVTGTLVTEDGDQDLTAKTLGVENGLVASPSIFFDSDTDLGFYRSSSDVLGVSVGGDANTYFGSSYIRNFGTVPRLDLTDSDTTDDDVNGRIQINCTDTSSGAEDCDLSFHSQRNGTLTESLKFDGDGLVEFKVAGALTDRKEMRFFEAVGNGANYIALRAPAAVTSSQIFDFPDGDGNANNILATNGSGSLFWMGFLDEDDLSSDSATEVASQQSIKAYVDAEIAGVTAGSTIVPTIQKFTSSSGTYTLPTSPSPVYIRVVMVGGGGGSSGSGTSGTGGAGGNGGNSTFGSSLLSANGGTGGGTSGASGAGGSASLGTGPIGIALPGAAGSAGSYTGSTATYLLGGSGGNSVLGGGGAAGNQGAGSSAGVTNTGGGGGGAGTNAVNAVWGGGGGGAGGYVDAIITSPSSSYSYAVGAAGSAGSAGTSGLVGAAGGSGLIVVYEHY